MSEKLPNFQREEASPKLAAVAPGITIAAAEGRVAEVVLRGAFRVSGEDRAELKSASLRAQVWVLAIERDSRACHLGRPGAEAVVFSGEEPKAGPVEGWFNVNLAACCKLPKPMTALYDVTAMIGPYKSKPLEVKLRA